MEFRDLVMKRRMVRNFAEKSVDPAIIDRILNLTRHAPSAGFTQGQSFVVVTNPETKHAIAATCQEEEYTKRGFAAFISNAPVLLVPCTSEAAYHHRYQEATKSTKMDRRLPGPCPTGSWTLAARS